MAMAGRFGTMAALGAGLLLAGCGDSGGSSGSSAVSVVSAATAAPASASAVAADATPTPTPTATPTPTPTAAAVAASTLAPLDLSDMRLWNYAGKWHASEWADSMSPIGWKFDHVSQPAGTDTYLKLDAAGAPELQAGTGNVIAARGLWEADVTLPQLKDGLIVAPLWLYDGDSRDEVDFELAGRNGLDLTLHASVNGVMQQNTVRLFAGRDMSGERHRYGIKVDETAGYVEMYLDGVRVQRWDRSTMAFFVSHPLKPILSMWAADPNVAGFVYWAGKWPGLSAGETLTMTAHGYGYTALP